MHWCFINDLYSWLTRGSELSLLDAVCLIIAIPSTFNIKLVPLAEPPKLGTIDGMLPGAIIELMSMALDAFTIYKDLAEPSRGKGAGADLAAICTWVKSCRLAISALYMVAGKVGMQNKVVDEVKEVFEVMCALVVFGLDSAVFVTDMIGDGEKDVAAVSAANTLLDTVASVGYYTASEFKEREPITASVGLACCQIAALGAIVSKGVEFRLEYSKE